MACVPRDGRWIIALDRSGLAGTFEQRIKFDPRLIASMEIVQTI